MDYFILKKDKRLSGVAEPTNLGCLVNKSRDELDKAPALSSYLKWSGKAYPDYIDYPVMLVSEKIKNIMEKYQGDAYFKTVVLIEKENNRQLIYYHIRPPLIDCIAKEPGCGKETKEITLDRVKVGNARIFSAKEKTNDLFVRLDVAESILRREPDGICFEKVEVINKQEYEI